MIQDQRVELVIVLAGARRDLGQDDAAVLSLQDVARRTSDKRPWAARLWYAYADALLAAGREAEAREWFARAAAVDADGETDAGDRLLALEGVVLEGFDADEPDEVGHLPSEAELAAYVGALPPAPEPAPELPPAAERPRAEPVGPPSSGVAAPVFVQAPPPDGEEDLRLFD
jgi:hypothetical protein